MATSAPRSISAATSRGLIALDPAGDDRARAAVAMLVAGVLGIARRAVAVPRARHASRSRSPIPARSCCCRCPEFLWALFFILLFGVALRAAAVHRPARPPASQRPVVTGFLLLDTLLVGRPDDVLRTPCST